MQRDDVYTIIMAGGKGERFWPKSRIKKPKQLLNLVGEITLIEQTVKRLENLVPLNNIIIITNKLYEKSIADLLPNLPIENIIGEPEGRDTAPCVALATALVKRKTSEENALMILLPADAVIHDALSMTKVLSNAADVAKDGAVVTIGVNPTFPSTGYGYVKCGAKLATTTETLFYQSEGFREKPDAETAKEFLSDSSYKWNSGMFIWSLKTISDAFSKFTPKLADMIAEFAKPSSNEDFIKLLNDEFPKQEKISVDYAIMEKIENVVIAECTFDWDDVGNWPALRNQLDTDKNNNTVKANYIELNSKNNIIIGDKEHLIATIDVEDLIIVQTEDVTLICKEESAQKIKNIVQNLSKDEILKKYV